MDIILCTVSSTDYNDAIIPGLVHFSLSSHLRNNNLIYAVFHKETNSLNLHMKDHSNKRIFPKTCNKTDRSDRYSCVRQMLAGMKSGDRLMVQALSDLGSTAEEASELYFHTVEKGIEISFYDASYINSQTLALDSNPTTEERRLIRRIINNYYQLVDNASVLSKSESDVMGSLPVAKKKPDA